MSEHLQIVIANRVMTLTLNRPYKKNALTQEMYQELAAALKNADADPQVRVILLRAEGDAFTAGNDLADFAAVAEGSLRREDMKANAYIEALGTLEKPCVAAVQGLAVGVGFTMLLHFDLVFVAEDAKLSVPFVNLGLVPEAASSLLLPARIGYGRAFALFALGQSLDGRQAALLGIATAAVPAAQLQATAADAARALATRPPGALRATKRLMRNSELLVSTMRRESEVFGARLRTPEAAEAFSAFAAKRPADFSRF
ncbi:MAG: enoyl-CoA hydratase-related protein [Steroidobacteraceae bacterium]